nr:MAG TPA: hypothetical protein [Caudoviricetes sp.]
MWLTFMWIGGDSNPDAPVCAGSMSTYPCLPTLSSQTEQAIMSNFKRIFIVLIHYCPVKVDK